MPRVDKTVFISYRRANLPWALVIYQNLTAHGYDVFFDYESIGSGDFEQVILGNIRARAHFLVVLTPSALERCGDPRDWLRREIETALDVKRNIIPIFLEGFDFGNPAISKCLTGKLANLQKYNGLNAPNDYFNEAMTRLYERYLNVPLDAVLHPISDTVQRIVRQQQSAANKALVTPVGRALSPAKTESNPVKPKVSASSGFRTFTSPPPRFDRAKPSIHSALVMKIEEDICIACGACLPECPTAAIREGGSVYVINSKKCNGCAGFADQPLCAEVCPVDCIVKAE